MAGRKRQAESVESDDKARKQRKVIPKPTRITRGMTIDAPRKAVFNTSELLESILQYLPTKVLFVTQRVSRQFCLAIRGSSKLQDRMLGRSKTQHDAEPLTIVRVATHKYRLVHIKDTKEASSDVTIGLDNMPTVLTRGVLHPLLRAEGWLRDPVERVFYGNSGQFRFARRPLLLKAGSWREVRLSNVACKVAEIRLHWSANPNGGSSGFIFAGCRTEAIDGFTIGGLLDAALDQDRQEYVYHLDGRVRREQGTARSILERLQRISGKEVCLQDFSVSLEDVIELSDEERAGVEDYKKV
ncbi:hypothetical protein LTR78_000981 [Recurvomyces mirabilis]|uniref:F-box domain-containing protein n=1 Tax=Recurvomyces mirabilis TaxID=574656 RepID=A0AAE1C5X4_9PEZI|nr:hypothetical protein LTR78_000981 [Recurvomyces mirabilis]KAK5158953.1 hypothetical protein LTS14_003061 [Recurvomyces mirabilis]